MAAKEIVAAIQRVDDVLRRRPDAGLHDHASPTARMTMTTDMPCELGSSGDQATRGQAR